MREPTAGSLPLNGLDSVHAADLARLTERSLQDGEMLAAIQRRAQGNPLFVIELSRFAAVATTAELPASIRDVIGDRLGQLSANSRSALQAASVLGRDFSVGELAEITGVPVLRLAERVSEAITAELVTAVGLGNYRFVHVLVQEVAYAELPPALRKELHLRAARSIEARELNGAPPALDLLAHHLRQAGTLSADPLLLADALAATLRAADSADRQLAYEQAAYQYRQALELLPTLAAAPVTSQAVLLDLARCQFRSGAVADAWGSCQAAADIGRAAGEPATVAQAALVVRGLSNDPICETRVESARLLMNRREPADLRAAEQHLLAALAIANRLGMPPLIVRVEGLRNRLPGGRSGPLSPREDDVAGLVAAGLSNRQIAEQLHLSERTVETHVRSIFTKLGFESRASIASWHAVRSRSS